jgi:hypothetical protein
VRYGACCTFMTVDDYVNYIDPEGLRQPCGGRGLEHTLLGTDGRMPDD